MEYNNLEKILSVQIGGKHYKDAKVQPAEIWLQNDLPACEGAVIKYVLRWREKGGIEDLQKAIHFLHMIIANEKDKNGETYIPIDYSRGREGSPMETVPPKPFKPKGKHSGVPLKWGFADGRGKGNGTVDGRGCADGRGYANSTGYGAGDGLRTVVLDGEVLWTYA